MSTIQATRFKDDTWVIRVDRGGAYQEIMLDRGDIARLLMCVADVQSKALEATDAGRPIEHYTVKR